VTVPEDAFDALTPAACRALFIARENQAYAWIAYVSARRRGESVPGWVDRCLLDAVKAGLRGDLDPLRLATDGSHPRTPVERAVADLAAIAAYYAVSLRMASGEGASQTKACEELAAHFETTSRNLARWYHEGKEIVDGVHNVESALDGATTGGLPRAMTHLFLAAIRLGPPPTAPVENVSRGARAMFETANTESADEVDASTS
jgi:hypothetical protein